MQSRLNHIYRSKRIAGLSKRFATMMEKGNVNGTLELLTNNMSNRFLPFDDNALELFHEKHPVSKGLEKTTCTFSNI